jgi:hypothetical protein
MAFCRLQVVHYGDLSESNLPASSSLSVTIKPATDVDGGCSACCVAPLAPQCRCPRQRPLALRTASAPLLPACASTLPLLFYATGPCICARACVAPISPLSPISLSCIPFGQREQYPYPVMELGLFSADQPLGLTPQTDAVSSFD